MSRRLFRAQLFVVLFLVLGFSLTQADTLIVTSTNDSGPGSLRQALAFATPNDEIVFDPTTDTKPIVLESPLSIERSLQIIGNGAGNTILDGDASVRVLQVASIAVQSTVLISGLTIRNGAAAGLGGAIRNRENLTVSSCALADNASVAGGAIYNEPMGNLIIDKSELSGNSSGLGGALFNVGNTVIARSVLRDNAADIGGAVSSYGYLSVLRSKIVSNTAAQRGGGLSLPPSSSTTLANTEVADNHSAGSGGGVYVAGRLTLSGTTIAFNAADLDGAGIFARDQGGSLDLRATNSTISGNSADGAGGAVFFDGVIASGTAGVYNVTITDNAAAGGGAGLAAAGTGLTRLDVANSILASQQEGADCELGESFELTSLGFNLDSDDSCGLDDPTDLVGVDPQLEPLGDNGGATSTHALSPGSAAVDGADPLGCAGADGTALTTDQRGAPRPASSADGTPGICDIGAFELQDEVDDDPVAPPVQARRSGRDSSKAARRR